MSVDAVVDASVEASYASTDPAWKNRAMVAVTQVAAQLETFTAEDVWDILDVPDSGGSALGGVMRRAAKAGYIELVEGVTIPSRMDEKHKRPTRIWRSKLHPNYTPTTTDNIPLTKAEREAIAYAMKFVLDRYPKTQTDIFMGTARKFGVRGI